MNKQVNKQDEREKEVFKSFIEDAGLECSINSFEERFKKRYPPAPDILYEFKDSQYVAFELVEILDNEFKNRNVRYSRTNKMFKNHLKKMPSNEQKIFREKFENALLYFHFNDNCSTKQRESVLEQLFYILQSLKSDYEDEIEISDFKLRKTVKFITIRRNCPAGPTFECNAGGFVGFDIIETLEKKSLKKYCSDHPIELLVYIDTNPLHPGDYWKEEVLDYLRRNFNKSCFRRIWIYKTQSHEIIIEFHNGEEEYGA